MNKRPVFKNEGWGGTVIEGWGCTVEEMGIWPDGDGIEGYAG